MGELIVPRPILNTGEVAPLIHPEDLFPRTHFPKTRRFGRGEVMFHQGDPGRSFYLVQDGIAKETIRHETGEKYITALATRKNPVILGIEILDGEVLYGNTAEAVTPVITQQIPLQDVMTITRENPEYSLALMRQLIQKIRNRRLKTADNVFLDLQARLAIGLLEATDHLDDYAKNPKGLPEFSNLTQDDLAAMIGGARASVNKLLGYWTDKGYLHRVGRRIVVQNSDALKSIGANEAVLEQFPEVNQREAAQIAQRMSA